MIYEDKRKLIAQPLVSCFVFTYNQQEFVKTAIESILSQECDFSFEVIICDDCSTDNTLQVCLNYIEVYPEIIRVVENDKNLGIRGNYFTNITRYCRGKYMSNCAGDDWWSNPHKLKLQVSYLEEHPEISMVHGHAQIFDEKTGNLKTQLMGRNRDTFEENLLSNGVAIVPTCFRSSAHTEYINEINPITLPFSEDYPMVLWFSYRHKIHFIDEVLCTYRLQTESLSHTKDKNKIYKGPKDSYDCKMVFVNRFGITDKDLIKRITLIYYFDRMRYGHLLGDEDYIQEGEAYFKDNHCYHYYILSKLYRLAGKNEKANKVVFYFGVLLRKIFPIYK